MSLAPCLIMFSAARRAAVEEKSSVAVQAMVSTRTWPSLPTILKVSFSLMSWPSSLAAYSASTVSRASLWALDQGSVGGVM